MNSVVNINLVKKYMEKENLSLRKTAQKMGLNAGYLLRVLNKEKNIGLKFVQGLCKLGYNPTEIFSKDRCEKTKIIDSTNIIQYICDYMNTMAMPFGKEYKLSEVKKIKRCISMEKEDRKKKNNKIKGNTKDGRESINKRAALIGNEVFKINVTARDIQLFKRCQQLEAKERHLINELEEEII